MFRNAIKVARLFGIDVKIDMSWLIVFFLFSFSLAGTYFPGQLPGLAEGVYWLLGMGVTLVFFATVLAHELSHSLVAMKEGIPIKTITLFIFGGVAQLEEEPKNPTSELKITLAGPLASLGMAALFFLISLLVPRGQPLHEGLAFLARINVIMGIFNLIPAFPLDGGRVLRALLWKRWDNLLRATKIAVGTGSFLAFFVMALGFMSLFQGSFWGLWYIILGWIIYQAGQRSYGQVAMKDILSGIKVADVMSRDVQVVPADYTIEQLVSMFYRHKFSAFPVVEDNNLKGLTTMNQVKDVEQGKWAFTRVGDIMTPLRDCVIMKPGDEAGEAMMNMASTGAGRVLVIDEGELAGILSNTDMMRLINMKSLFGR